MQKSKFIKYEVLNNYSYRDDKRYLELEKELDSIDYQKTKERKIAQNEIDKYKILIAHKNLKNAKFLSLTRGKSEPVGFLDTKLARYIDSDLRFVMNGEFKYFDIDVMVKTKNGWKIMDWD